MIKQRQNASQEEKTNPGLLKTEHKNLITVYTQWNPIIAHESYFCVVHLNKGNTRTRTAYIWIDPITMNAGDVHNHYIYGWVLIMHDPMLGNCKIHFYKKQKWNENSWQPIQPPFEIRMDLIHISQQKNQINSICFVSIRFSSLYNTYGNWAVTRIFIKSIFSIPKMSSKFGK